MKKILLGFIAISLLTLLGCENKKVNTSTNSNNTNSTSLTEKIKLKGKVNEPPLPVYNPSDLNPKVVDVKIREKDKNHTIGDFKLINQLNKTVTPKNFENKIYVSSFIFTTCPDICPVMTQNIKTVYSEFIEDDEIKFLSHSVTPEIDSVPVLKAYADNYGITNHNKWHFTTANKKHIYELARMHYFAATDSGDGGPYDFIHTENLVLVDKEKRLRGFYDGTDFDEIDRLIKDIYRLKEE